MEVTATRSSRPAGALEGRRPSRPLGLAVRPRSGRTRASVCVYGRWQIRCSIVVSISACHAEDPGSIPGGGAFLAASPTPGGRFEGSVTLGLGRGGEQLQWRARSARFRASKSKADSTLRASRAVPHPSTDRALCRLTSEVERDPVHSTRYGRQRLRLLTPQQAGSRRRTRKHQGNNPTGTRPSRPLGLTVRPRSEFPAVELSLRRRRLGR